MSFLFSTFLEIFPPLTLAAEGKFPKCKEKEAHIQESRILQTTVSFQYIFQTLQVYISKAMTYYFISDETCGQVDSLLSVSQNVEISNPKNMKLCHNDIIIMFL